MDEQRRLPYHTYTPATYANVTGNGLRVHVHGFMSYENRVSRSRLDWSVETFALWRSTIKKNWFKKGYYELSPSEADQARSIMSAWLELPISDAKIDIANPFGNYVSFPGKTSSWGYYDDWVTIPLGNYQPDNATIQAFTLSVTPHLPQRKALTYKGPSALSTFNFSVYVVPPQGLTIFSDVDDILREAEVWSIPKQALLNVFARPFKPWMNMPQIYAHWAIEIPSVHFHYASETPITHGWFYERGLQAYGYPAGTYEMRSMDWGEVAHITPGPRMNMLIRALETFTERKFILVGDTSSPGCVAAYARLAAEYPDQVQCILVRDVDRTREDNWFSIDPKLFASIPINKYLMFPDPDSLLQLDTDHLSRVANGTATGCFPPSVRPANSLTPPARVHTKTPDFIRALGWRLNCDVLWMIGKRATERPDRHCMFDRRD
ncbi:hypothetical protein LTR66_005671 [Elasticomyces elasticus]|nr:hypothetical protein LTR50_002830 [Elasticomyces elasticus]KAK4994260.1 hypothetical protein LTR66_005671 [Elasticomyces elasticus]